MPDDYVAIDQSTTIYIPTSGVLPTPTLLQFSDQRARIRGLTITNSSTATIGVFFDKNPTSSNSTLGADVTVASGQSSNIPVARAKRVYLVLQAPGTGAAQGFVYVHYTTDLVASATSTVTIAAGATQYNVNGYTTFPGAGVVFQWGNVNISGHDAQAAVTWPTPFGTAVYSLVAWAFPTNFSSNEQISVGVLAVPTLVGVTFQLTGGTNGQAYQVNYQVIGI